MSPRDLGALFRPWQWSKNGILFAGLIFSRHLLESPYVLRAVVAFGVFCIASSAIYALNDVLDVDRDRIHPVKRNRPVAAGRISPGVALGMALLLTLVALAVGWRLGTAFLTTLLFFLIVNAGYSVALKNVVILDVMVIATSFVIRAIAGVMALRPLDEGIELSPWLLVCTLFLALFLGFGKRRHELSLLEANAAEHRATLSQYSVTFLDQLLGIVTSATIIGYAIYTIAPGTVSKYHSPGLVYTIPFVTFGVFRYLYLLQMRREGGSPSRTLYRDLPTLLTTLGWLATVVLVVYAGGR